MTLPNHSYLLPSPPFLPSCVVQCTVYLPISNHTKTTPNHTHSIQSPPTFPAWLRNSSNSFTPTRCESCMQNTVRLSRSSSGMSSLGDLGWLRNDREPMLYRTLFSQTRISNYVYFNIAPGPHHTVH